jgi:hypothetical protein
MSVKRGLFGRAGPAPDAQNVNGQVGKKFEAWKTALQKEDAIQYLMPLAGTRRKIVDKLLQRSEIGSWYSRRVEAIHRNVPFFSPMEEGTLRDLYNNLAGNAFLKHDIKARLKEEQALVEERANQKYVQQFILWLQGKGDDALHAKTPWGRKKPALELKEVRDYMDSFLDIFYDTWLRLTKLVFNGPNSLNEYWIYYKFVLHADDWPAEDPIYFLDIRAWFDDDYSPMTKSGVRGPFGNLDNAAPFPPRPAEQGAPPPPPPPPPEAPPPPPPPEPAGDPSRLGVITNAVSRFITSAGTALANTASVVASLPIEFINSFEGVDGYGPGAGESIAGEFVRDIDELMTYEKQVEDHKKQRASILTSIDSASERDKDVLVRAANDLHAQIITLEAERDEFGRDLHNKYGTPEFKSRSDNRNIFEEWDANRRAALATAMNEEQRKLKEEEEKAKREAEMRSKRERRAEREAKRKAEEDAKAMADAERRRLELERERAEKERKAKMEEDEKREIARRRKETEDRVAAENMARWAREKESLEQDKGNLEAGLKTHQDNLVKLKRDLLIFETKLGGLNGDNKSVTAGYRASKQGQQEANWLNIHGIPGTKQAIKDTEFKVSQARGAISLADHNLKRHETNRPK